MDNLVKKRSLINTYFTNELKMELFKVTMEVNLDNNAKGTVIKELLTEFNVPYTSLGSGTNRMAVLIDGYAVKIALDKDGMIDNRREMLYTKDLQPYVVKVYECTQNGLLAVTEYITIFTLDEYNTNQETMRDILKEISKMFLIGDVGITNRNYVNWGTRDSGEICILDFAYIYSVKYKTFTCTCDDTTVLRYDNDFVYLICPNCGKKYRFAEIRKRLSRKAQEEEIGDILRLGYILSKPEELVEIKPEFEPNKENKTKKKKTKEKTARDIAWEKHLQRKNKKYEEWDE